MAPRERANSTVPSVLKESTTKISSETWRALESVAARVSFELKDSKITVGRITTIVAHGSVGGFDELQPWPASFQGPEMYEPGAR